MVPFSDESAKDPLPVRADPQVLARPPAFCVPITGQQTLFLEPTQQWIQRVGIDVDAGAVERFEQRVPVAGLLEKRQDRDDHGSSPDLLLVSRQDGVVRIHARTILCDTH